MVTVEFRNLQLLQRHVEDGDSQPLSYVCGILLKVKYSIVCQYFTACLTSTYSGITYLNSVPLSWFLTIRPTVSWVWPAHVSPLGPGYRRYNMTYLSACLDATHLFVLFQRSR